jgi:hypothetical protein
VTVRVVSIRGKELVVAKYVNGLIGAASACGVIVASIRYCGEGDRPFWEWTFAVTVGVNVRVVSLRGGEMVVAKFVNGFFGAADAGGVIVKFGRHCSGGDRPFWGASATVGGCWGVLGGAGWRGIVADGLRRELILESVLLGRVGGGGVPAALLGSV